MPRLHLQEIPNLDLATLPPTSPAGGQEGSGNPTQVLELKASSRFRAYLLKAPLPFYLHTIA